MGIETLVIQRFELSRWGAQGIEVRFGRLSIRRDILIVTARLLGLYQSIGDLGIKDGFYDFHMPFAVQERRGNAP